MRRLNRLSGLALCWTGIWLATGCGGLEEERPEQAVVGAVGGKADGQSWSEVKARCLAPADQEQILYANDFFWDMTREQMRDKYEAIYASGKRLANRFYFDPEHDAFLARASMKNAKGAIPVDPIFIESITRHLEQALRLSYVEFVFFPDMGHNHFHLPTGIWEEKYLAFGLDTETLYENFFAEPSLLMLYHTAEQLKLFEARGDKLPVNDPYTQKRYWTRNITGDNQALGRIEMHFSPLDEMNTVRAIEGYKLYSAGVNISASALGCFPFELNGETFYFDISLDDLPYLPNPNGEPY